MKILHIYKSYYPYSVGGVEKHIHSLTESLSASGIESAILTTKNASTAAHTGLIGKSPVYYFPANANMASCPMSFSMLKNFRRLTQDFDILHFHFPWPFADLMQFVSTTGKRVIITYHSDIVKQRYLKILYNPLMHWFFKQADAVIASSDNYLRSSPVLTKYQKKTTVIPFGMGLAEFPIPTPEEIAHWQRKVGKDFFLFVGVLRYYKGLDFLLEAAHQTHIPVVIAGAGPEERRLKQLQAEKNLNNVIFVGSISETDKAALYHLCRATIAPSHLRTEAFCISLLESLIFGKPAISTELNTGTSFVNQHNVSGLVVEPTDPAALGQAMRLLLTDEALYQRLKQGTQTHYHQYFTVEKMRDKHLELYHSYKG